MQDLHELPKIDSLSYLYVEHAVVNRKEHAIEYIREDEGRCVLIPIATLSTLLLRPGTRITHAAISVLADNGCSVVWVGEEGTKFYAQGCGETRHSLHTLRQAELSCDPRKRLDVVRRMYQMRFPETLDPSLSLEQIPAWKVHASQCLFSGQQGFSYRWHGRGLIAAIGATAPD